MIRQGQGNERHLIVLPLLLCCLTRLISTSSPTNPTVIFGVCLLHQFFLRSILYCCWTGPRCCFVEALFELHMGHG
ncbi:hypothetical protein PVAP13_4NG005300 [Panicum virgatum]|uniref:Secreted protein n=1 Tax=Panicum virgatum TaxID=38727 RepID=A0A8T0T351_PANVG|nr:hypothetical protein PVAP13_4NG005300 [Panicum virgatum]